MQTKGQVQTRIRRCNARLATRCEKRRDDDDDDSTTIKEWEKSENEFNPFYCENFVVQYL